MASIKPFNVTHHKQVTTHGETQSDCWPLCSNARRWGVRPRRGWLTSPLWGTYVYLLGTTYRVGLHDVPLEGLVQVCHCIRGTDAVPPPPRPTAQEQRYDAGLINTNPRTITGHVKQIANNQTNINQSLRSPYGAIWLGWEGGRQIGDNTTR